MSNIESEFSEASERAKHLAEPPDNATLLKLYALYKQATKGDVEGKRPGRLAMVDRAKHDAWAELEGTSEDDARHAYIDLVERLESN